MNPRLYPPTEMAEDARRLLDHLGIAQADVMGYSMGARVAAFLTISHPERVRRAVFAGLASRMITGVGGAEAIAQALEAASRDEVTDPGARSFRIFAEQTKSDLKALAACIRSSREKITAGGTGVASPCPCWWWRATRTTWRATSRRWSRPFPAPGA